MAILVRSGALTTACCYGVWDGWSIAWRLGAQQEDTIQVKTFQNWEYASGCTVHQNVRNPVVIVT